MSDVGADVLWLLQLLLDPGSSRGTTWLRLLVTFSVLAMALSDLCMWVHVLHVLRGLCWLPQ